MNTVSNSRSFIETGEFIKSAEFELIWYAKNVNRNYDAPRVLSDDDYLDYKLWEDMNSGKLFKKHLPQMHVFNGKNPNIIFHGSCVGCMSQRLRGFDRCIGCQFFRGNWCKEDLHIKGEESATISANELMKILNQKPKQ